MKTTKDKYVVLGSDLAGYPLKCAVAEHLEKEGYKITDLGVTDPNYEDPEMMFQRVGFRVGSKISDGEFEKGLLFCGTGMGIHIAASKCPGVIAGVVESVPAGERAVIANGVNVLAMGAFYVAPRMGCEIADKFLEGSLGKGYENFRNFYDFHKLALDEINAFDYAEYKKNGYRNEHLGEVYIRSEGPLGRVKTGGKNRISQ